MSTIIKFFSFTLWNNQRHNPFLQPASRAAGGGWRVFRKTQLGSGSWCVCVCAWWVFCFLHECTRSCLKEPVVMRSVFPVKSAAVQSVTRSPWIIHRAFSRFCQIVLGLTLNPSAQQVNQGSFFTHAGTQGLQKALNGQHFSGNKTVENSLEHLLNSKGCRIW